MIEIDENFIKKIYIPRAPEGYKGDYGHTFIVAGSKGFTGAAYFSALGAVRSGSGLVTLATPNEVFDVLSTKLNEAMIISIEDCLNFKNLLKKCSCLVFGPGMGATPKTKLLLDYIIESIETPLIIDADGLNVLKKSLLKFKEKKSVILTPHFGEFSRLTDFSIEYLKKNKVDIAIQFAKENNVILILKDHRTIITDGNNIFINSTGNSSMANGGMGDILSGIIGSFISQGYSPLYASILAVYFHGLTGDVLSKSMFCVNPTHILESFPFIMKDFFS
ncbi:NAD(P)H-hydrate dehydratase [Cetobacterium sp. 2A]|uniref:NAD(P)H-hydrate dehydratase n=1 Tax=Cetobacterium sp. 2A TaxID=2754723 RepID=UPI00163C8C45|nr:NAD(P)H-hydrate dehydratase [Cetobacterium sp. 2A]MBC2855572.1 NAD(P)H-hydrate dehydratase [Cetobacterium sp. 2A]